MCLIKLIKNMVIKKTTVKVVKIKEPVSTESHQLSWAKFKLARFEKLKHEAKTAKELKEAMRLIDHYKNIIANLEK